MQLVDVLDDRGEQLAQELGPAATYAHLDVTDEDGWTTTVEAIRDEHGALDVLVNNAAVLVLATIDLTTSDEFERVIAWHVN